LFCASDSLKAELQPVPQQKPKVPAVFLTGKGALSVNQATSTIVKAGSFADEVVLSVNKESLSANKVPLSANKAGSTTDKLTWSVNKVSFSTNKATLSASQVTWFTNKLVLSANKVTLSVRTFGFSDRNRWSSSFSLLCASDSLKAGLQPVPQQKPKVLKRGLRADVFACGGSLNR